MLQVRNYFEVERFDLFQYLETKPCKFVLIDSTGVLRPESITPYIAEMDFAAYDTLVIGEDLEGEALFSAIAATIVSIAAGITTAAAASLTITSVLAVVLEIGASLVLGAITMALTPNSSFSTDPSIAKKNLNLSGTPTVDEQGGPIPVIVGECFFGAVKAGQNISTVDISVTGNDEDLDKRIPEITTAQIKTKGNGQWYRITS